MSFREDLMGKRDLQSLGDRKYATDLEEVTRRLQIQGEDEYLGHSGGSLPHSSWR
jgi:hypothetical protein